MKGYEIRIKLIGYVNNQSSLFLFHNYTCTTGKLIGYIKYLNKSSWLARKYILKNSKMIGYKYIIILKAKTWFVIKNIVTI